MGNNVLSECRTGVSDHYENDYLPTMPQISCTKGLNKKYTKKQQQPSSQIQNSQKQQQSTNLYSSQILKKIHRSQQIDKIYQSLIQQKPLQYSIQRKQYVSYLNVQLIEKLIKYKSLKKDSEMTKISLSSAEVKKLNIEQTLTNIQIIQFKFQTQNFDNTSMEKTAYRERSLSKSFDINQQQNYEQNEDEQQLKNMPSLYNLKEFTFINKRYFYIGHVNAQYVPHGPGQLYGFLQISQNYDKKNDSSIFIQAEFNNGSIQTNDAIIINENGSYYRGGFVGFILHGKGKLCQNDGLILQGNFNNGLLSGKGKATYPDLGTYEGYFHQGLRQGKGIMTWRSQKIDVSNNTSLMITYEGYFQSDQMQGLGNLKTPNYQYWGPFVRNMKQGKGTLKFNDGRKYQGWFQKDQISGYGQLHYPDGFVQKGIFPLTKQQ